MKRNRPLNEEKRKAIIKAAIKEFYNKGFNGSSMDSISTIAKVSKATVYKHFKNKEELFLHLATIFKERLKEAYQYTYDSKKDIEQQLFEIAKKEMNFLRKEENIKLIRIMTVVMVQRSNVGQKILDNTKDEYVTMTAKWFEEAKEQSKLDFEDSLFVAKQFIGVIKSFAFIPQLYGAEIISEEEELKVITKAIEMIKTMYMAN